MKSEFREGDVILINREITITKETDKMFECSWFDENQTLRSFEIQKADIEGLMPSRQKREG